MMKLFVLMISFLFCMAIAADARSGFDLPEDKVCVVDVTDNLSDVSMASIEVDLTVELKILDQGGTIVTTEGISPPSVKSPMIIENNKLKFKESMSVVINPIQDADTTTESPGYKLLENIMGLSSGGSSGEPVLRA